MKEFYIAPEVELLCFEPVENIANDWLLLSNGNGQTPNQDGSNFGIYVPDETTDSTEHDGSPW